MTTENEELLAKLATLEITLAESLQKTKEQEEVIARLIAKGQEREARYLGVLEYTKDLERRVETHHLTGLYNKTAFEKRIQDFVSRIERYRSNPSRLRKSDTRGAPYGVFVMLDLDEFKFVNDIIGHNAGDEVLIRMAQFLGYRFKHDPRDIVGHFGGDEFGLLLNRIDLDTARMIIERDVRTAIRAIVPSGVDMAEFSQRLERDHVVDVSFGLVYVDNPGLNFPSLVSLAENNMGKLQDRRRYFQGR